MIHNMQRFIGLMSGTSVDAIDAVLVSFEPETQRLVLEAHHSHPLSPELRQALLALCQHGEVDALGALDVALGYQFAAAVQALLAQAGITPQQVTAIGSHGQTVRHRPGGAQPFTLQIGDPNIIVEQTGITTVADFRRRDVAAGGQGAPLVPAFHAAWFQAEQPRVVVNIGGMANITVLPSLASAEPVLGFDTGPGNVLLDAWIYQQLGLTLDQDGAWAASGQVQADLLQQLLSHPFLALSPPKSTGRESFNLAWLQTQLQGRHDAPQDVQATLVDFTAVSIAQAIQRQPLTPAQVLVCGGGAYNPLLLARLQHFLGTASSLVSTAEYGLAPRWVEAVAFAWLARQTLLALPGNLPAVTGARHPVILGGIYSR